jgi:hypothetical protein
MILAPNESVEKVIFLKSIPSAGSKIGNYHFPLTKVCCTPDECSHFHNILHT